MTTTLKTGAPPDATAALSARAQMPLRRVSVRRDLARSAQRVLPGAMQGPDAGIFGGIYQRQPSDITIVSLGGIGAQNVVAAEVALTFLASR